MKKYLVILSCLTLIFVLSPESIAGVRVQKDYRFTTQQDRNKRIEVYHEYLEKTGIFDESHHKYKTDFKEFQKDENYQENLKHVKHGKELSKSGYRVKGNYYQMADKILANYSVIYDNDPYTEYVYNTFGKLYQVIILTGDDNVLPYYKAVYAFNGYLQKVHFFAVDGYEYIFLANGDLQGVVVDNKLYNQVVRPVKVWLL